MRTFLFAWLLVALLSNPVFSQRYAGTSEFGSGIISFFCVPGGCDSRWNNFPMTWRFDLTVQGREAITFHQLQGTFEGTMELQTSSGLLAVDLLTSLVFEPITVPLFQTIDDRILVTGFFPEPSSMQLHAVYRSLEFSGVFDGELNLSPWWNGMQFATDQDRLFIEFGDADAITVRGSASSGANYCGGCRLPFTPTFPSEVTVQLEQVMFAAQTGRARLSAFAAMSGDYNSNGAVDAADYVLWRNGGPLANDPTHGVQPEDYDVWRSNFGATLGAGLSNAVPEPATSVLVLGVLSLCSLLFLNQTQRLRD